MTADKIGETYKMKRVIFSEWALEWVESKRMYIKESTYANYKLAIMNHLIPEFGNLYIDEITRKIIQETISDWSVNGRVDGDGGLSCKTIKDLIIILKMCLRDASINSSQSFDGHCFMYPHEDNKREVQVLSNEAQDKMIRLILKEMNCERLGYIMSICTGIRLGELCALQWGDIDMGKKLIKVQKTLQRLYIKTNEQCGTTKIIITSPKSRKSIRTIPISVDLYNIMIGYQGDEKDYVLTGTSKYIEPRLYRKHYDKFLKDNHLEYIRFHGLRHTFATRCIEEGADYKIVSELLGHASINLTMNLYVHPQLEQKRQCVDLIRLLE